MRKRTIWKYEKLKLRVKGKLPNSRNIYKPVTGYQIAVGIIR